jgi:hypothetical protein
MHDTREGSRAATGLEAWGLQCQMIAWRGGDPGRPDAALERRNYPVRLNASSVAIIAPTPTRRLPLEPAHYKKTDGRQADSDKERDVIFGRRKKMTYQNQQRGVRNEDSPTLPASWKAPPPAIPFSREPVFLLIVHRDFAEGFPVSLR